MQCGTLRRSLQHQLDSRSCMSGRRALGSSPETRHVIGIRGFTAYLLPTTMQPPFAARLRVETQAVHSHMSDNDLRSHCQDEGGLTLHRAGKLGKSAPWHHVRLFYLLSRGQSNLSGFLR